MSGLAAGALPGGPVILFPGAKVRPARGETTEPARSEGAVFFAVGRCPSLPEPCRKPLRSLCKD